MEDHAQVNLGEYKIPLIGVDVGATMEKCDKCGQRFYLQAVQWYFTGRAVYCPGCWPVQCRTWEQYAAWLNRMANHDARMRQAAQRPPNS